MLAALTKGKWLPFWVWSMTWPLFAYSILNSFLKPSLLPLENKTGRYFSSNLVRRSILHDYWFQNMSLLSFTHNLINHIALIVIILLICQRLNGYSVSSRSFVALIVSSVCIIFVMTLINELLTVCVEKRTSGPAKHDGRTAIDRNKR